MERTILVAETVLSGGKLTEVPRRLWDDIVVELEDDAAGGLAADAYIKLGKESVRIDVNRYEENVYDGHSFLNGGLN